MYDIKSSQTLNRIYIGLYIKLVVNDVGDALNRIAKAEASNNYEYLLPKLLLALRTTSVN